MLFYFLVISLWMSETPNTNLQELTQTDNFMVQTNRYLLFQLYTQCVITRTTMLAKNRRFHNRSGNTQPNHNVDQCILLMLNIHETFNTFSFNSGGALTNRKLPSLSSFLWIQINTWIHMNKIHYDWGPVHIIQFGLQSKCEPPPYMYATYVCTLTHVYVYLCCI